VADVTLLVMLSVPLQQLRATQPALQVISPDNPAVLLHPGSGQQPPSQQTSQPGSSPRPQTLQVNVAVLLA